MRVKHATLAVKSIDKAARETSDAAARVALEDARGALSAWLALEGLVMTSVATAAPVATQGKRGRPRKNNTALSTAS